MTDQDTYFGSESGPEADAPPIWLDLERDLEPTEVLPGLFFRPVVGQGLAVNLVRFAPNTAAPRHSHSEEQAVVVLEGEVEFEVAGDTRRLGPFMALIIPPNTPHAARTYDSHCVALDAFVPPRHGLAEMMDAAIALHRADST